MAKGTLIQRKKTGVEKPTPKVATKAVIPRSLWFLLMSTLSALVVVVLYLWQPWQPARTWQDQALAQSTHQTIDEKEKAMAAEEQINPSTLELPEPQFQFYELLPKQKISMWDQQTLDAIKASPTISPNTTPSAATQRYLLQLGSFQNAEDADRLIASSLVAGVKANIAVTSQQGQPWYRVYAGPFATESTATRARQLLLSNGLVSVLVKQPLPTPIPPATESATSRQPTASP